LLPQDETIKRYGRKKIISGCHTKEGSKCQIKTTGRRKPFVNYLLGAYHIIEPFCIPVPFDLFTYYFLARPVFDCWFIWIQRRVIWVNI